MVMAMDLMHLLVYSFSAATNDDLPHAVGSAAAVRALDLLYSAAAVLLLFRMLAGESAEAS